MSDSASLTHPLDGRTAIVTGSSAGIGAAIARALADAGAEVLVTARSAERAEAVVSDIESSGGRAHALAFDGSAEPEVLREFARDATSALGGRVDILVNNAGIYPSGPSEQLSDDDLQALLHVNIRAPHVLVAALVPGMLERGSGTVINIVSFTARWGGPSGALYPATKAALEQLTRGWAAEYGPRGVRVNAVSPGAVLSQGNGEIADVIRSVAKSTPAGEPVPPEAVAAAVRFLASDEAAYLHGATIDVDGGIGSVRL